VWSPPIARSRGRSLEDVVGRRLDLPDRLGDVERAAGDVAGVRDLLVGERMDVEGAVVGPEETAGVADSARSEPGAGAVGHAAVERDPEDGDVADVDVLTARQARERGEPGEPGDLQGIERTDRGRTRVRGAVPAVRPL
jgi:hypothetical protein